MSNFYEYLGIMRLLFPLLLSTLLIVVHADILSIGRTQSSGVKGYLTCDGKPVAGVKVKLYDDDRGKFSHEIS